MPKTKILVVDDEKIFREIFESHLIRKGFEVITAASGEEALQLIKEDGIDLVLLDAVMFPMNAVEVLKRLQKDIKNKKIKVIVIAHIGEEDYVFEARKWGANDYFTKATFKLKDLAVKIERLTEPKLEEVRT